MVIWREPKWLPIARYHYRTFKWLPKNLYIQDEKKIETRNPIPYRTGKRKNSEHSSGTFVILKYLITETLRNNDWAVDIEHEHEHRNKKFRIFPI